MTRILFLVNDLTVMGGSTKVTYELANQWGNQYEVKIVGLFQSQSHFPFSLSSNIETEVLYEKKCQIHELKTYVQFLKSGQWKEGFQLIRTLSYLFRYRKQAKKSLNYLADEFDIIIIPDIHGLSFLSSTILNEKKIIVQLHNTYEFLIQNKLIMKTLFKNKDKIDYLVTLTKHDQEAFRRLGFLQTIQIYNAVTMPEKNAVSNHNKIVFLGRLDSRKGVDYLVPLMKKIQNSHSTAHLHIYGNGPEEEWLKQQIQSENLQSRITMHGYVTCLDKVFKDATCYWLPSRWEGLPLTLLESLAYGVPAVAFQCFDGIYEVLPDEKAGYVILQGELDDFVSATLRLLNDSDHWKMMSISAHEQACYFDHDIIQSKWQKLLSDIIH
ncbi:glycosyltransferase [Turicibacter sanguinis]|uniref:glycosyltransferase n=1 Tax=Turicibacter sanguinis TaxID=154288 RepID=UPI00189BEA6B|nr:glycosyltransferase [Turicibacter sanguinis]